MYCYVINIQSYSVINYRLQNQSQHVLSCYKCTILFRYQLLYTESITTLKKLVIFRIARNDLEVVHDLVHLQCLRSLTHLRIDENPFSLLERTVPFAIFCVPSLDTVNGKFYYAV